MLSLAASAIVPPSLPGPSLIDTFVFERPELFLILQLIAAAIILWRVNQHGMLRKLWFAPLICVVVGLSVYAYGSSVETVRERLMRQTHEFVDALVSSDRAAADALLAEQLVVERIPMARDKATILAAMSHPYVAGIQDHAVTLTGAVRDDENSGRTQAKISASHESRGSTRAPGIFEFAWRRTPDGQWVMTKMDMLRQPF